jgi:hypothetical protein
MAGRVGTAGAVGKASAAGGGAACDQLAVIARCFEPALAAYEQSLKFVLSAAAHKEFRTAFFDSVPYLMLAGVVLAGWQMARAALACQRILAEDSDAFYVRKLATSTFYASHILPRALALQAEILEGAAAGRAAAAVCEK